MDSSGALVVIVVILVQLAIAIIKSISIFRRLPNGTQLQDNDDIVEVSGILATEQSKRKLRYAITRNRQTGEYSVSVVDDSVGKPLQFDVVKDGNVGQMIYCDGIYIGDIVNGVKVAKDGKQILVNSWTDVDRLIKVIRLKL